jgi:hypothetical protein
LIFLTGKPIISERKFQRSKITFSQSSLLIERQSLVPARLTLPVRVAAQ